MTRGAFIMQTEVMVMKIPKTVRISGIDYQIELLQHLNDGEKVLYGRAEYDQSSIKLNTSNQEHQFMCVTLWHEILHVICSQADINLGEEEEQVVDKIAYGIYQVLQDNGKAFFD